MYQLEIYIDLIYRILRYEGIFVLCPNAITIYATIQHNVFSN